MDNFTSIRRRCNDIGNSPNMFDNQKTKLLNNISVGFSETGSEVKIVLLGKTGSGKSSTGNTILCRDILTVEGCPQSVTRNCQRAYSDVGDRTVCVVDTPGLSDTRKFNINTEAEIVKALDLTSPGPHVFLLVIRLDVKFTAEEKKAVEWIEENFGEEVRKYIIVLFTHGGWLQQRNRRKAIAEYLREGRELMQLVDRMADYHVFENNAKDGAQVTELLEKINRLRRRNKSQVYTREMYNQAQEELQKKYMKYAGLSGGAAGAAGGGAVAAAAVGMAKTGIVLAGAATGGIALAGIAIGAVAVAFFFKKKQINDKTK